MIGSLSLIRILGEKWKRALYFARLFVTSRLKRKSDDKIDEFIEENLTKMDIFLE